MESNTLARKAIRKILFESIPNVQYSISSISKEDVSRVINLCDKAFSHSWLRCSESRTRQRLLGLVDFDKSIKMVVDGEIVGFYLLSTQETMSRFMGMATDEDIYFDIKDKKLYEELKNKSGIQGLAVGILENYRNKGLGKILLEYPKSLGYDYIWGCQMDGPSNMEQWLKRRKIIASYPGYTITAEMF
jgi:GNAT superfamily N-acetyltransferase